MDTSADSNLVREVITEGRYLVLATTDGDAPWAAPIEYMNDDELDIYFISPRDSRHARHIEDNSTVAVAIFDGEGLPEYSADLSTTLRGVQMRASAERLSPDDYPEMVSAALDALNPPMPPYEAYRISPTRVYLPRIRNGVNERVEVELDRG